MATRRQAPGPAASLCAQIERGVRVAVDAVLDGIGHELVAARLQGADGARVASGVDLVERGGGQRFADEDRARALAGAADEAAVARLLRA